jgi:membrane associated rhomboid family serine protease
MRIKYNAPTTLTFSLICAVVLLISQLIPIGLIQTWFSAPGSSGFNFTYLPDYVRLFTHVIGHADWNHLLSNLAFLLLLGPILEQAYGSLILLLMMGVTAFVTGLLNVILFRSGLMGASGIVFMMILLASFTNIEAGEIPITFILILVLYLGREVVNSFTNNNVSEFAHLIGGLCGSLFGFLKPNRK